MQACTESSYHNFRKERLSAVEAGADPQAEESKGPCLVPATVQTESAALLASQPEEHPASAPQHEPQWVKIHPSVGISHIPACLRLAADWGLQWHVCPLLCSVPACCTVGDDACSLHMYCWAAWHAWLPLRFQRPAVALPGRNPQGLPNQQGAQSLLPCSFLREPSAAGLARARGLLQRSPKLRSVRSARNA